MEKRKSLLKWAALPVFTFLVLVFSFEAFSTKDPAVKTIKKRVDMIAIDALRQFGPLERPAVVFLNDLHTEALAKENQ